MSNPKLFISYCWSSAEHEQWVVELATELRESGVDVILDKWDLKEGHDAVAFMEQMVTKPDIKKVAIICDELYAAKADGRAGGVGTETQIISKEVYENQAQEKFVAVVREKDESGKPYLPTYYTSRIYIDLSEADAYANQFEKLLRWVYDKPLHVKPELGNKPSFLSDIGHLSLGTTTDFRRCLDAVKNKKLYAAGAIDDFFHGFVANLERFRLSNPEGEFDEAVIKSIDGFLPYRNQVIQLVLAIAQHSPNEETIRQLHRFLEDLIPYTHKPKSVSQWMETDFDNFRFVIRELFLYALAILLKYERFGEANVLLEQQYHFADNAMLGLDVMSNFTIFEGHLRSLDHRNARLSLGRASLRADLLKERSAGTGIDFGYLMQADFVAFMRAEFEAKGDYTRWWPDTLILLGYRKSPLELFARCISKAYFAKVKAILGVESKADLEPLLASYNDGSRRLPKWGAWGGPSPAVLLGYEHLATRA